MNLPVANHPSAKAATLSGTPPTICIIVQNQSFGGMEVHTLGLMEAFIDCGYHIELVSNRYRGYDSIIDARGWQDNVRTVHTDLAGILYGENSSKRLWMQALSGLQSRVLIFPKGDSNYGQAGFLRACRLTFDRIIFVEHLDPRPRPKTTRRWLGVVPGLALWWHKRRILSRRGSRYADRIVAVSRSVKDRLVQDLGYDPEKVVVVRNGVPWQRFWRDAQRGAAFRAQHGMPLEAFVFGMLGRLEDQKGIDIALRALHLLGQQLGETRAYLVVAGDGIATGRIDAVVNRLGIRDRVKFIGFVRDPAEVLSGYDVILFSSRNEDCRLPFWKGWRPGAFP